MANKWGKATEARTRAVVLLTDALERIRRDTQQMLLEPSLDVDYSIIVAYQGMLAQILAFGDAISTSNAGYWKRDLPQELQDIIAQAEHAMKTLVRIYGPQAVSN